MIPVAYESTTDRVRPNNRPSRKRTVAGYALAAAGLAAVAGGLQTTMNTNAPEQIVPDGQTAVLDHDANGHEVVVMLPEHGTPEQNSAIIQISSPPTTER